MKVRRGKQTDAPTNAWPKGFCPNPRGRKKLPPEHKEIKDFMKEASKPAAIRMVELAQSLNEMVALRSCEAIQFIAWGKPGQELILNGGDKPIQVVHQMIVDTGIKEK